MTKDSKQRGRNRRQRQAQAERRSAPVAGPGAATDDGTPATNDGLAQAPGTNDGSAQAPVTKDGGTPTTNDASPQPRRGRRSAAVEFDAPSRSTRRQSGEGASEPRPTEAVAPAGPEAVGTAGPEADGATNPKRPVDPTAVDNLAMVTPLQFVTVPGIERPVMLPPITSHIPIVPPAPMAAQADAGTARPDTPAKAEEPAGTPFVPAEPARTEPAVETATPEPAASESAAPEPAVAEPVRTEMPPLPAGNAHGLEPLDAVTAGLGRTRRNKAIQWGSIIVGGAALVVGIIFFITAVAR